MENNMQKLHPRAVWLFFFRDVVILIVVGFILSGNIITAIKGADTANFKWFRFGIIYGLALLLLAYLFAWLEYRFWRYQITDIAIKIEKGVVWKKYISIPYERIQNVDIYRGLFARILGLSDIHIQTAGYSAGGRRSFTEGRLPGIAVKTAEELRDGLIMKTQGRKQGL